MTTHWWYLCLLIVPAITDRRFLLGCNRVFSYLAVGCVVSTQGGKHIQSVPEAPAHDRGLTNRHLLCASPSSFLALMTV